MVLCGYVLCVSKCLCVARQTIPPPASTNTITMNYARARSTTRGVRSMAWQCSPATLVGGVAIDICLCDSSQRLKIELITRTTNITVVPFKAVHCGWALWTSRRHIINVAAISLTHSMASTKKSTISSQEWDSPSTCVGHRIEVVTNVTDRLTNVVVVFGQDYLAAAAVH